MIVAKNLVYQMLKLDLLCSMIREVMEGYLNSTYGSIKALYTRSHAFYLCLTIGACKM